MSISDPSCSWLIVCCLRAICQAYIPVRIAHPVATRSMEMTIGLHELFSRYPAGDAVCSTDAPSTIRSASRLSAGRSAGAGVGVFVGAGVGVFVGAGVSIIGGDEDA